MRVMSLAYPSWNAPISMSTSCPRFQGRAGGVRVRQGRSLARGHDGLERRLLRSQTAHLMVDFGGQIPLAHARPYAPRGRLECFGIGRDERRIRSISDSDFNMRCASSQPETGSSAVFTGILERSMSKPS